MKNVVNLEYKDDYVQSANTLFHFMAFNIVVDKEEILENGDSKLFFKDMENDPMYISSKILLSEEEAKKN